MSLDARLRHVSGVAIFTLRGRLTGATDHESLGTTITDAVSRGERAVLLDCEHLDYVSSSGLGELVSAYAAMIRRGGMLKILRPHRRVRELLQVTKIDTLIEVYDSEESAVGSFSMRHS